MNTARQYGSRTSCGSGSSAPSWSFKMRFVHWPGSFFQRSCTRAYSSLLRCLEFRVAVLVCCFFLFATRLLTGKMLFKYKDILVRVSLFGATSISLVTEFRYSTLKALPSRGSRLEKYSHQGSFSTSSTLSRGCCSCCGC